MQLNALLKTISQMNFNQNNTYQHELRHMFRDRQLHSANYLALFMLGLISSQNETSVDLAQCSPVSQILSYINAYHIEISVLLPVNYELEKNLSVNWATFVQEPSVVKILNILLRYMIMNDFPNLSKQFFKFVPLSLLVNKIMQDEVMFTYRHAFYINLIYKLIYKHSYEFNDKR